MTKDPCVIAIPRSMPSYHGVADAPGIKETDRKFVCAVLIRYGGEREERYEIVIHPGFRFDGASIPRFLWRLCGHPFQSPRDAAALVHDWLYATRVFPRAIADSIYANAQWECGVPNWKVTLEQFALAVFGGRAWRRVGGKERRTAWKHGVVRILDEAGKAVGRITRRGREKRA